MPSFSHLLNKIWVRWILGVLVLLGAIYIGIYAALYRISDAAQMNAIMQHSLDGTQRKITFSSDVGRRLSPRPTVILRDVVITETDGKTPAAQIGEMRIGVAWSSLFSNTQIEKLVLNNAAAVLSRQNNGLWNWQDLQNIESNSLPVNRLQINNGNVMVQLGNENIALSKIQYSHEHHQTHITYHLNTEVEHKLWSRLNVQASGLAQKNETGNWLLPNLSAKFDGQENHQDFSGSLASKLTFNPQKWIAEETRLIVSSNRFSGHSDVNIKKIIQENNELQIIDTNGFVTGEEQNKPFSGNFTIGESQWQNQRWHSKEIQAALLIKNPQQTHLGNTHINLNGQAQWSPQDGWQMNDMKLTTRQEVLGKLPRLISEFSGSLNIQNAQNWQVQAQGMFDRQSASVSLNREDSQLNGLIQLAKLNLANYLDYTQSDSETQYPDWLSGTFQAKIDVNINTLNLPSLEINELRTTLQADRQRILFEPLLANLYSGSTEGSLTIANQSPIKYTLQQKAHDVQILPFMQDVFGSNSISGKGQAELLFQTTGNTRQRLTENLSGSLNLNLEYGNWHGLNLNELMSTASNGTIKWQNNQTDATPFSSLALEAKLQKGVSHHTINSTFLQPAVQMMSKGHTNLLNGQISDEVTFYSNNKQNRLPLKLSGTLENPTISLDYEKITQGLKTPEQKRQAVENTLKKQWDWLKENSNKSPDNLAVQLPDNLDMPKQSGDEKLASVPKGDLPQDPKLLEKPVIKGAQQKDDPKMVNRIKKQIQAAENKKDDAKKDDAKSKEKPKNDNKKVVKKDDKDKKDDKKNSKK